MNSGKRIAELRMLSGLSQEALAERLHVSRSLVARWENGSRRPDSDSVEAMSALFGVAKDSIVERDTKIMAELAACLPKGSAATAEELRPLLDSFLATLHDTDRRIFVLRYHFLLKPAEIEEKTGIGGGRVRISLFRTRQKLREFLTSGEVKL